MIRFVRCSAVVFACLGMLLPRITIAAGPQADGTDHGILDVALADGGVFQGEVVDADNLAAVGREVVLLQNGREVGRTLTDDAGRFSVSGLRGGVYEVVTNPGREVYRLWAPGTAPPSANPSALLVAGDVVRGQSSIPAALRVLSHPWTMAGGAAAGIGIAMALDKGSSS